MTVTTDDVKAYYDLVKPKLLSWDFIEPYTNVEPNFGSLGLIVYYRTYSRYIPELKRRESWWEMILRVVEYSLSLYKGPARRLDLVLEAEELYRHIFEMKVFPAGRTMWSGGVENLNKYGDSQFNCSATVLDSIKSYTDIFHLLLVGKVS